MVATGANGVTINTTNATGNNTAFLDGEFSGDTAIFNTIRSGHFSVDTVEFGGLVVGQAYEIQFLVNDARASRNTLFATGFSDGTQGIVASELAGTAGIAQNNNSPDATNTQGQAGVGFESGDFIIGTFVANATTQSIEVGGTNTGGALVNDAGPGQIQAIQIRSIIPEAGTFVSLLALLSLSFFGRRKRVLQS